LPVPRLTTDVPRSTAGAGGGRAGDRPCVRCLARRRARRI